MHLGMELLLICKRQKVVVILLSECFDFQWQEENCFSHSCASFVVNFACVLVFYVFRSEVES